MYSTAPKAVQYKPNYLSFRLGKRAFDVVGYEEYAGNNRQLHFTKAWSSADAGIMERGKVDLLYVLHNSFWN